MAGGQLTLPLPGLTPVPKKAVRSSRPRRRIPDDFAIVFVEQGRLECETWYRVGRITVNRWLAESGKTKLIARRAAFVKHLRDRRKPPAPVKRNTAQTIRDKRRVSPALARRAAHFLRCVRNGGWVVAPVSDGDWLVGTRRRSPVEVVDMAVARGFDRVEANLQLKAEEGVGPAA